MKNQKTKKPTESRKPQQARKSSQSAEHPLPEPVGDVRTARRTTPEGAGITVSLDAERNCVIFGFHGREEHCVYLTRSELLAVALCVEEILEGGES
jgi:hypothetical protein